MGRSSPAGSSTSPTTSSSSSPRSGRGSRTSASPGPESPTAGRSLTPSALRALAARHQIRPRKSLGQHFLIEPQLARRIAVLAQAGPGRRVVEVGAGLGSLTVALAAAGADVLALEVDPGLLPALAEAVEGFDRVRVVQADAMSADWGTLLGTGDHPWAMVANLPYNVAVRVLLRALELEPRIERFLVMVQREVGQRLAAAPGHPLYGAVSLKVAYRAQAKVVRAVSRSVFWPRPNVDSVLVSMVRRPPPEGAGQADLMRTIGVAFAQRRKTMRNALVRLGLDPADAVSALEAIGVRPSTRPEELGLDEFVRLTAGITPLPAPIEPS